ncbi:benzaldehyde dehydrogenase [Marinobacterium sp. D7]|uniref:benzaldehyde dehydrogenase n=1 Tax=Marinobacterium ramblicola TaxID=2849041 RepID=UPI001C2DE658|nr:benzaldehyde dehydrogenase [Marinobacterium ramblicola]
MSVTEEAGLLDAATWNGRIFDGSWRAASGGSAAVVEPATGEELTRVGMGDAADIAIAARAASEVQAAWAATPPREMAAIFTRAANLIEAETEAARLWIARESGAIFAKAEHEIREAAVILRRAAGMLLDPHHGLVLPSVPGALSYAKRTPLGVVGVISPFNFPLILSIRAVAPALAAGNSVVLKPDPRTPISGGFLIARLLERAGLPKGVLHVIPGQGDAGEALCTDPHVRMIAFTGSTAVGRRVGELAGRHLKKVMLELGGKNPLIIAEDADLDLATSAAAFGAWFHQGQICMASGRIIAHESIAEELAERLAAKAVQLPVGNPADGNVALGPIINENQLLRVDGIVQDSVAAGAVLKAGGKREGRFYPPTVLTGVRSGMRAYSEEFFGPVASIISYATDEEAIAIANDTEFGLSAGVISASVGRAMAIGERLNAGMVHINDQTVNDECTNPFGGRGASGNGGSIGGPADWDEFTQWQWFTVKEAPRAYPF